jgi:hypothetical protein
VRECKTPAPIFCEERRGEETMKEPHRDAQKLIEACAELAEVYDIPFLVLLKEICLAIGRLLAEKGRKKRPRARNA